ncbi:MAG: hypothetical protein NC124_01915 [Clostridium sp.]|nr:hypothetical protein [Clostridium sp.]MCM1534687.1 hypothetical protein [Clostridium sp.]
MRYGIGKLTVCMLSVCLLMGCSNRTSPDTESETEAVSENQTATSAPSTEEPVVIDAELQAFYEDYVEQKGETEPYKNGKWAIEDIDADGVGELILTAPNGWLSVVRYQEGEAVVMYENKYSTLLENGMIRYYSFYGGHQGQQYGEWYRFYKPIRGEYREEAVMHRYDTTEDEYNTIFGENDWYEMDKGEGLQDISQEEWTDSLKEYLEYPRAELAFQGMSGEEKRLLAFQNETEAYQAFLNGECGVVLSDTYTDDIQYLASCLTEGEEYTLYDILNRLNNEPWRYEVEEYGKRASFWVNYGTDISYTYIDCGRDGRKELALRLGRSSADYFQGIYILQYRDNQLYLCYGIDSWSRRHVWMNQYGYLGEDGSGGAWLHGGMDILLDGEGVSHRIWEYTIRFQNYNFTYYDDDSTAGLLHEAEAAWMEEHDINTSYALAGLSIQMSIVDGNYYYTYDYSPDCEKAEDIESFIQSCEEAGVSFSSESELAAAIQAREEEFDAAAIAKDRNELIWMEIVFSEDE